MDPTVLTPSARFAVTDRFGEPRSPSRSPNRRNYFTDHELDPLLSNLSPTSTLEALEATDVFASNRSAGQDALQQSVAAASTAERALGIRAALAGKKLREWYNDLSAWPWPENSVSKGDGFRMRPSGAHERKVKFYSHEGHIENVLSDMDVKGAEEAEKDDSCGSIPAKLVQDYEDRIETIRDDMEALGVEDLKDFVRDAHVISNARRNSRRIHGNGMTWAGYNHLDDFTAVITATIMQALPTISRLNSLLAVWSTRLLVLRQVPEFLALLDETNGSITGAWAFLNDTFEEAKDEEFHTNTQSMDGGTDSKRAIVLTKRADLESQIFELGRRLDNMLDELEGREDTIPEEWIDGMESIEAEFGDWVVEAEKKFMEYEWKMHEKNAMQGSHKAWPNSLSGAGKLEDIPSISRQHETTDVESQNKEIERSLGYVSSSHRSSPSSGADGEEYRQEGAKDVLIYIEPVTPSTSVTTSNIQKSGPSQKDISFNTDIASKSPFTLLPSTVHEVIHEISAQNLKDEETIITGEQNHPDETSHLAQDSLGANLTKILSYENSELNQETGNKELNKDQNTSTESQPDEVNFSNDHSNANAASPTQPASIPNDKLEIVDSDISRLLLVAASSPSLKNSKDQLLGYSKSKQSMTPRPAPLVLRKVHSNIESTASSEISTDTSYPNSGTSDYFSNLSSPEIRHASVAEYFDNPVEIMTPSRVPSTPLASISRQSSQRTERDRGKTHEDGSPSSYIESTINRRRASSFVPVSTNPKTAALADELQSRRDYAKSHIRVRSASLKSFEIVPRNEVRTINIGMFIVLNII